MIIKFAAFDKAGNSVYEIMPASDITTRSIINLRSQIIVNQLFFKILDRFQNLFPVLRNIVKL